LIGGAGADTFQWSLADLDGGVDRVMDFEVTKVTGTPWKYTVDFNDSITGFDNNSNENIKITINGKTYTESIPGILRGVPLRPATRALIRRQTTCGLSWKPTVTS
jgi:hypothetical protein